MDLQFWPGAVMMIFIATLTASLVTNSGRSAWLVGVFLLMVSCLLHDTLSLAAPSPMKEPSTDTSLRCKMRSLGEVPEGLLILNENRPCQRRDDSCLLALPDKCLAADSIFKRLIRHLPGLGEKLVAAMQQLGRSKHISCAAM
jgi:hypothetical protein